MEHRFSDGRLYLSTILQWYDDEFIEAEGSVQKYVAKYWSDPAQAAIIATLPDDRMDYLDYDWSLNAQPTIQR